MSKCKVNCRKSVEMPLCCSVLYVDILQSKEYNILSEYYEYKKSVCRRLKYYQNK